MSLKNFIAQVEQSKQLNEFAPSAPSITTTQQPQQQAAQKVMVKPGQPQQQQQQQGPQATVTNQAGQVIAQAPAADAKKLGDMVNAGNITMMDPQTGKPLEEDGVDEGLISNLVNRGKEAYNSYKGNREYGKIDDIQKHTAAGHTPDDIARQRIDAQQAKARAYYDKAQAARFDRTGSTLNKHSIAGRATDARNQANLRQQSLIKESEGSTIDEALQAIFARHPHEHKMCQEGWGMHESLYEALRDHYFEEGRIPRELMHGDREALHRHVEECYAQDTMGGNEDKINSGMLDEEGIEDRIGAEPEAIDTNPATQNPVTTPAYIRKQQELGGKPTGPVLDEVSELEKSLTNATEESTMFESKKLKGDQKNLDVTAPFGELNKKDFEALRAKKTSKVDEATEETPKGKIHKAGKGGYGNREDEDETSKEDTKFDSTELDKVIGGKKPTKEIGKLSVKKRIKTKADSEEIDESISKWDAQLKTLLEGKQVVKEGLSVSTSVGNEGAPDSVSITANDDDAHELLKLITSAGLGIKQDAREELLKAHGSTADGGSFSINGDEEAADAPEVVDFGTAQDSISGEEDDGMAAMKQMLAAMGIGKDTAQEPKHPEGFDGEEEAEELVGEDSVDDQEAANAEEDTQVSEEEDIDGGEEGQGEWAGTGETDAAAADVEKATDSEEAEDEKVGNEAPEQDDDAEKVNEGEETCNECGAMYEGEGHTCSHDEEQLNEWANSPEGQSEEEQFQADINFMTKLISGGLNGPKVDQTTLPHTNVKANSGGYDIDVAAEMKKLAGIK